MVEQGNITNRKTIQIEWGDCDPAQIVHYPSLLGPFRRMHGGFVQDRRLCGRSRGQDWISNCD